MQELTTLPKHLLECPATELKALLGGPTLLHLQGEKEPALFVSLLLHGNEVSGWDGLRRLLAANPDLPRSMSIFIGNIDAAEQRVRTLPNQQDFNRIWRGATGPEGQMAASALRSMTARKLFAAVDLHNNTGRNPHYSVLTDLSASNFGLAYLFSNNAVYIREPDTVLTSVLSEHCPAIALELGPVGDPRCAERSYDYLTRLLQLEEVPTATPDNFNLFRTVVRVHIPEGIEFSFADTPTDSGELVLTAGIESINFHEMPAGTSFGLTNRPLNESLRALDVVHDDVTDRYFQVTDNEIRTRKSIVPAMYTTDPQVIRQDCLCYFMERITGLV